MSIPGGIVGDGGGPYKTLKGAVNVHDADVHSIPINELFHRHTGVSTTLAVPITAGDISITVVNPAGFVANDNIQIENGVIETTHPQIIGIAGPVFTLDRPIDNDFAIGDPVEQVEIDISTSVGSIGSPVSFKLIPDADQTWHIVRFLLGMIHASDADDGLFGSIAALTNGCTLRAYNGLADQFRTFTNWKSNGDIKMDMFDLIYTDKAGPGVFGTNGRGSIKIGTGAVPAISGANGDYIELLVQDDLTGLIKFNLKGQGHLEEG